MKIVVANFKANLAENEVKNWLTDFSKLAGSTPLVDKEIILCPPTLYLELFRWSILKDKLPVKLGAQVVSEFEGGNFTGEVTAAMLSTYVQYVLIGHSEERRVRKLSTKSVQDKITQANNQGLKVILCAETPESYIGKIFALAYEPSNAISDAQGKEKPASPELSFEELNKIRTVLISQYSLYGGSVNPENVNQYSRVGFNGVLVGKHSLNPEDFWQIVSAL